MAEEIIRYGAGGAPYRGQVGPHSDEAEVIKPEPAAEEDKKHEMAFEEDDTPVTDDELADKTGKGK